MPRRSPPTGLINELELMTTSGNELGGIKKRLIRSLLPLTPKTLSMRAVQPRSDFLASQVRPSNATLLR
jgi:hypothetical protein